MRLPYEEYFQVHGPRIEAIIGKVDELIDYNDEHFSLVKTPMDDGIVVNGLISPKEVRENYAALGTDLPWKVSEDIKHKK